MEKKLVDIIIYSILSVGIMAGVNLIIYFLYPEFFKAITPLLMFIPLVSVLVTNALISKRPLSSYGVAKGKISVKYIILALVFPLAIIMLAVPFALILGFKVDFTFSKFYSYVRDLAELSGIPYETLLTLFMINALIAPFINTVFAFGEEAGWRGFLLTRLEEEFDRNIAIIISGLIWGLWHWPLILLIGYDYTYETRFWGALIFLLYAIVLGSLLSWLRFKTESVIMPSLAHGSFNAYTGFGVFLIDAEPILGFPVGILSLLGLLLLLGIIFYLDIRSGSNSLILE